MSGTPETQLLQQGGQMLQQGAQQVMQSGGGFLSGLVSAPFNAVAGLAKGAVNGLISKGLWMGLASAGLMMFAPDIIPGAVELIGKPEWGNALRSALQTGGAPAYLATAFGTGAAVSTLWGAATGAIGGVSESFSGAGATASSPQQAQGIGLGTMVGGGLALAAVTAVAIGALNKDGIAHDAGKDDKVEPPKTPGSAGAGASRSTK